MKSFGRVLTYFEGLFGQKFWFSADNYSTDATQDVAVLSTTMLGQVIEFFLVNTAKSRGWVLAGIGRQTDKLEVFRIKAIFEKTQELRVFLRSELCLLNQEPMIAIIGKNAGKSLLRHAFYVREMIPREETSNKVKFLMVGTDGEIFLPGESAAVSIKNKQALAAQLGIDSYYTQLELEYLRLMKTRQEAAEQKKRKDLEAARVAQEAEREAAKIRRTAEKEQRRQAFANRSKTYAYTEKGLPVGGIPVTLAEYEAKSHFVLDSKSRIIVVEDYDQGTGTSAKPIIAFILEKSRGGTVAEVQIQTHLSFDKFGGKPAGEVIKIDKRMLLVNKLGEIITVLVLNEEQVATLRSREINSGTLFIRSDAPNDDESYMVYKLVANGTHIIIDTVGRCTLPK